MTRVRTPEHRINKTFRFAEKNPRGTVLPCVVHDATPREDGTAAYREVVVNVRVVDFDFGRALVHVVRLDLNEATTVDLGWFAEAEKTTRR